MAGLEGHGEIKLSPYSVEQFERYLSEKNHNKNKALMTNTDKV